eukprot:GILJ01020496.1.p1 GENE.GILJ01020496.1~~GILJ01020496.1.p1  ORF type:complete len:294 (-),score=49.90 GILJ01020496.1:471-1352(-)
MLASAMPLQETTALNDIAHNKTVGLLGDKDNNQLRNTANKVAAPFSKSIRSVPLAKTPAHILQTYLLPSLETLDRRIELTVIFDLDETLVSNRRMDLPSAILRPYALHMLNAMRQIAGLEIVLWTASTKETAAPVVHQLHERGIVFDELIFRNDAWFTEPVHTKDLRLLGRDMNRVVVFDNAANCVKLNTGNAVLVEDFMGSTDPQGRHDGSLVNLYYIVDILVNNCVLGNSVQETLATLAVEGQLCRNIYYQLPEAWAGANLRETAPLMVPPHGKYVRAGFISAAPLEHWTI